jgi:hypothetical protein
MGTRTVLNILDHVSDDLLTCRAEQLANQLGGPTLIHLPGRRPQPLFVSCLLHGNETGGWIAIQNLLRDYQQQELPRSLSIFIGNVAAAEKGLRRLDAQPDYNRVWPGTEMANCPESEMMQQICNEMVWRDVFASIDIHNNTGLNPHYACVNSLDYKHLQLATLFGRQVVYFLRPVGVQSAAFTHYCPAVTLECGKPDNPQGSVHAYEFVKACLHHDHIPDHPVASHDIDLFHTIAQVKVSESASFSFTREDVQLTFVENLERLNFQEVPEGTTFAYCHNGHNDLLLEARDEQGKDVTNSFFTCEDNRIELTRTVMPSMLTTNETVIRQDCLCYLMERLPLPA